MAWAFCSATAEMSTTKLGAQLVAHRVAAAPRRGEGGSGQRRLGGELADAGEEHRLGQQSGGGLVIGVALVGPGDHHHRRAQPAQHRHHPGQLRARGPRSRARPRSRSRGGSSRRESPGSRAPPAPGSAAARAASVARSSGVPAVASSPRDRSTMPVRWPRGGGGGQQPSAAQLDVVGVGAEGEQVQVGGALAHGHSSPMSGENGTRPSAPPGRRRPGPTRAASEGQP